MYPDKTITGKNIHTPTFIAALFTIAKIWEQPRHPSTDERIKKIWCIQMKYFSVTKSYLTLCNPMDCSTPGSLVHLLRFMSIESVMLSNHLILFHLLLLLPSKGEYMKNAYLHNGNELFIGISQKYLVFPKYQVSK